MKFNTITLVAVLSAVTLNMVSSLSNLRGGRDLSVSKEVLVQQLELLESELAEMDEEEEEAEEEEEEESEESEDSEEEEEESEESESEESEESEESQSEDNSEESQSEEESEESEESQSQEEEEPSVSDEDEEEGAIEYDGDVYDETVPDGYDPTLGDFGYPGFENYPEDNDTPMAPIGGELPVASSDSSEE